MEVLFTCPHCGCTIETDSELSGARAECPGCSEIVLVPAPGVEKGIEIAGFRIEEKLGAGGMGEVFLATQLAMDRPVALKILPPALTSDELMVKRFLHEVRMAAKMEHPNIVTAFDAGEADGFHYMAMSFVEGDDLKAILKEQKVLDEGDALTIVERVADALDYAWTSFKMLHRDLKPANIMITSDGEVKLMDMGIAKSVSEESNLTMKGMLVGTPFYVSPEQAMARADIDCRADIYSLGATLFQMVTGQKPHQAPNAMAVVAKHMSEDIDPPQSINPEISDGCDELIIKMMARDREERFADWKELKAALAELLSRPVREFDPSDATRVVTEQVPIAPPQSNRTMLAVAGTVAAILAIVLIGGAAYVLTRDPDGGEDLAQTRMGANAHAEAIPEPRVIGPEVVHVQEAEAPIKPEPPIENDEKSVREDLLEMLRLARGYVKDHPEDGEGIAAKYGLIRKHAQEHGQMRFVMQADDELRKIKELLKKRREEEARKTAEREPDPREPDVDDGNNEQAGNDPAQWHGPVKRPVFRNMPIGEKRPLNRKDNWRNEPGRNEPDPNEMDNRISKRPSVLRRVVPDVYEARSKSELMRKLGAATDELSKKFQFMPAMLLVDRYDGKYREVSRRDRDCLRDKLRKKYETFEPLRQKVLECLFMIREHRHDDAERFVKEIGRDRDVRRTGTSGRNALKVLESLIDARRRPDRKPRGLRGSAAAVVGAFDMVMHQRMKDAVKKLESVQEDFVAEVMLGEMRWDFLGGAWFAGETPPMNGEPGGAEVEFHVDGDRVVARFGEKQIEGRAWMFGDWIYVETRKDSHCWRIRHKSGFELIVPGYSPIKLRRGHMPGNDGPEQNGPDEVPLDHRRDNRMDKRRVPVNRPDLRWK